jgi:hypothetical protein
MRTKAKTKINTTIESEPLATRVALHPFLAGMNRMQLALLTDCAMAARFEKGETILSEGEFANRCYLIETGKVVLEFGGSFGEPLMIETIGPGDLLGWSWMFPPYTWQFTRTRNRADHSDLFLWHDSAGILRKRPLVRLRTFQTHECRDDQALTGRSQANALCPRARRRS